MIRRSFRLGLTLGLLGGLAIALAKMLGGRHDASPTPAAVPTPWPRLDTPTDAAPAQPVGPVTTTAAPDPAPAPAPARKAKKAPLKAAPATSTATKRAGAAAAAKASQAEEATKAEEASNAEEAIKTTKAEKATKAEAAKRMKASKSASTAKKGKKAAAPAWVVPDGDVCPTGHPVKARLASGIFHVPGMLNYLRTRPDRCYRDAAAAEADGLRAAKR